MDLSTTGYGYHFFFFFTRMMITTGIATDAITMINNITRTAATVTPVELDPLSAELGSLVVDVDMTVVVADPNITEVVTVVPIVGLVGGPVVGSSMF